MPEALEEVIRVHGGGRWRVWLREWSGCSSECRFSGQWRLVSVSYLRALAMGLKISRLVEFGLKSPYCLGCNEEKGMIVG